MKNLRNKLVRWLIGDYKTVVNKAVRNYCDNPTTSSSDEFNDIYLFDFKNYIGQYENNLPVNSISPSSLNDSVEITLIKVIPKDVLNELETIPTPFTLNLIDEKIAILNDKIKLINQKYAKREMEALIERLNNRKKYLEFKSYFDGFQNTTDEKIDVLLNKYGLVMKTSDIFIPEFPLQAIEIMKQYTEKLLLICNKKPIFYVIATNDNFKKAYEKRDPILLVQSPFGFYWQILGAWDKEMIMLSEL